MRYTPAAPLTSARVPAHIRDILTPGEYDVIVLRTSIKLGWRYIGQRLGIHQKTAERRYRVGLARLRTIGEIDLAGFADDCAEHMPANTAAQPPITTSAIPTAEEKLDLSLSVSSFTPVSIHRGEPLTFRFPPVHAPAYYFRRIKDWPIDQIEDACQNAWLAYLRHRSVNASLVRTAEAFKRWRSRHKLYENIERLHVTPHRGRLCKQRKTNQKSRRALGMKLREQRNSVSYYATSATGLARNALLEACGY